MDRLTFDGNFCDIAMCGETRGGSFCEAGACTQRKVWERLKAYEDSGLTPEQVQNMRWIPVEEGLPKEHYSVFAKDKGTNRWNSYMWESQSDSCNVVVQFKDGSRMVTSCRTQDGKWARHPMLKGNITHWMQLPDLPDEPAAKPEHTEEL